MKSLDEVIELNENILTFAYLPKDDTTTTAGLSLFYLREYREMKNHLACMNNAAIRGDNTQIINNPPLTWDELEKMTGKPIWVEYEGYAPDWEVIEYIGNTKWKWGEVIETHLSILHKEDQGKTWKAYRKEKHENA